MTENNNCTVLLLQHNRTRLHILYIGQAKVPSNVTAIVDWGLVQLHLHLLSSAQPIRPSHDQSSIAPSPSCSHVLCHVQTFP